MESVGGEYFLFNNFAVCSWLYRRERYRVGEGIDGCNGGAVSSEGAGFQAGRDKEWILRQRSKVYVSCNAC